MRSALREGDFASRSKLPQHGERGHFSLGNAVRRTRRSNREGLGPLRQQAADADGSRHPELGRNRETLLFKEAVSSAWEADLM